MAQITIEKLYRGERNGEKYGGIMGAVEKDILAHGVPKDYDEQTWSEMLIVKHTLEIAEKLKAEGDFVSGMTDVDPLSFSVEVGNEHSE